MLSYEAYKVLHIVGAFMTISGLAAVALFAWLASGNESLFPRNHPARKLAVATHGFGLLVILIAGFGMLARLHIPTNQAWIAGKLGIWVGLGGIIVLARRMPKRAPLIWLLAFILGGAAAALAIYKP